MKVEIRNWIVIVFVLSAVLACGEKNEDEESSDSSDKSEVTANSIDDFNLSDALNFEIPDGLSSDGGSSLFQSSKKSLEACEVGRIVEQGLSSLRQVGSMFCHLEVETESIEFGKKYNITLTGGDDEEDGDDMALWVDDSKLSDGQLTIYMCQAGSLTQLIKIEGADETSSKGTIIDRFSDTQFGTHAMAVNFDVGFSETGKTFLSSSSTHKNGSESYMSQLVLSLVDTGISHVAVTSAGTWGGATYAHAGAAKVNSTYGQVLFNSSGTQGGQSYEWTHRGYFDDSGFVVSDDATSAFAEGGDLHVEDADVPKFLPSTFTVADFPASAWDCKADNDLTIDMSGTNGAKHDSCSQEEEEEQVDCWSSEYEQSDEEHEIEESDQKSHDQVDELDEISG